MSNKDDIKNISYDIQLNDKVKVKGNISATVKYIGPIRGKPQCDTYYGIVLKKPKGDTNGTIKNKMYFKCNSKYGKFVKREDIVYPFPIFFNELCDTTLHMVSCIIFLYFDPVSIGNFCQIHNGLCKIVFNVQRHYNLNWKKHWRLFISPKSEETNFNKRWKKLYEFYRSAIYDGDNSIRFGVWKITNIKDTEVPTNKQKAMVVLRALLRAVCEGEHWRNEEDECNYFIPTKPDKCSLKFDSLLRKIKIQKAFCKATKKHPDVTFRDKSFHYYQNPFCPRQPRNQGHSVRGSIYYEHIQTFSDIFENNVKKSKPFLRMYSERNPLKELRNILSELLMPSFMELVVKQWFVVSVEKKAGYRPGKPEPYSYIIGWISAKKLIVVGGCYGRYDNEA